MLPIKHYTLTLRATRHKRGPDAIDEPDLLFQAIRLKGHSFRQFVKGEQTETREFWQDAIEGLEAMVIGDQFKKRDRRGALLFAGRIAEMLVGPPSRIVDAVPKVEERVLRQKTLI